MRLLCSLLLLTFVHSVALAAGTLFDRDLVRNGQAELDPGTLDPRTARPASHWQRHPGQNPVLVLSYGARGNFPSARTPGPPKRGNNFFWGGFTPRASSYQDIDLSAAAAEIDAHRVSYMLAAWIGGLENIADHAAVSVDFRDSDGMPLGSDFVGPVTNADREGKTSFLRRERVGIVPRRTRLARITIVMIRFEGESNDGYVDGISFVLHDRAQ